MAGTTLAAPAYAADPERTAFDARPADAADAVPGQATRQLRRALGDQGLVSADPSTGTVRAAAKLDGALTRPSGRDGEDVALDYVREHARALGLARRDAARPAPHPPRRRRAACRSSPGRQRHQRHPVRRHLPEGGARRSRPAAEPHRRARGRPRAADARARARRRRSRRGGHRAPPRRARHPRRRRPRAGHRLRATARAPRSSSTRARAAPGSPGASSPRAGDAELADAIVDAADGTVVKRANRVKFATPKVFASNPDDSAQADVPLPGRLGHRDRPAPRHPRPRLPRPGRRRRLAARARPGVRDQRLGRRAPAPGRLRRDRALHVDLGAQAAQPGPEHDAALLPRQHVPRPPRRRADRLHRRDGRLRRGRPHLRPGDGLGEQAVLQRHPQQRELRHLPGRRQARLPRGVPLQRVAASASTAPTTPRWSSTRSRTR